MTKIYTKTGDDGTTGLNGGCRINKHSILADAIGDIDELNCEIGIILSWMNKPENALVRVQNLLFRIGAVVASDHTQPLPFYVPILDDDELIGIEKTIDQIQENLPELKNFILPGGPHMAIAHLHRARAICRRAERKVLGLENMPENVSKIMNRLSDLLFVLARYYSQGNEVIWTKSNQTFTN